MKKVNEELSAILEKNQIKKIALYGYGVNAKRLLEYFSNFDVEVYCVIDKNYREVKCSSAYSLEMEIPDVDSVCVTLCNPEEEIMIRLKTKLPNCFIWKLADLNNRVW